MIFSQQPHTVECSSFIEVNEGSTYLIENVCFDPSSIGPECASRKRSRARKPHGVQKSDWNKRYTMFSKFDMGIMMDKEAWFEVTPENVARYVSLRLGEPRLVVDCFSGVGGNTIQFSHRHKSVTAVDSSSDRILMAKSNCKVYNAISNVEFVQADARSFLESIMPSNKTCVYASPPWGGKECYQLERLTLDAFPVDLKQVIKTALVRVDSVVLHLPRNMDLDDLSRFLKTIGIDYFEIERICYTDPELHVKCLLVFIDRSITDRDSVLTLGRQSRLESIASLLGTSVSADILSRSLIHVSYLYRYMRSSLRGYNPDLMVGVYRISVPDKREILSSLFS
jgi:16S rRNA G966 N2-methylase RsmD